MLKIQSNLSLWPVVYNLHSSIATTLKSPRQNANKQCLKLLSDTTICIMQITTTYFGPAELKNLYIMTSRDRQRMYSTGKL